jgi:hypothetical protein
MRFSLTLSSPKAREVIWLYALTGAAVRLSAGGTVASWVQHRPHATVQ